MIKIIPILMGVVASYVVAAIFGKVDFSGVANAAWIGLPIKGSETVFSIFNSSSDKELMIASIIAIMPIAFATMMEHVGY